MLKVPGNDPVAVGLNSTEIVQVDPAASDAPHVSGRREGHANAAGNSRGNRSRAALAGKGKVAGDRDTGKGQLRVAGARCTAP